MKFGPAAERERENALADRQAGWDREDAVYGRKRGDDVEDRDAAQKFALDKIGMELQNSLTLKNADQAFGRASQNAGFEHDNQKQAAQLKHDFEQNELNRALKYGEQRAQKKKDMYQMGKDAGLEGQNLFDYGQDPHAFDILGKTKKDPKLFNHISWFRGKPSAQAVPRQPQGVAQGAVQDGYIFLGGNPADPNNWRPQ